MSVKSYLLSRIDPQLTTRDAKVSFKSKSLFLLLSGEEEMGVKGTCASPEYLLHKAWKSSFSSVSSFFSLIKGEVTVLLETDAKYLRHKLSISEKTNSSSGSSVFTYAFSFTWTHWNFLILIQDHKKSFIAFKCFQPLN